VAWINLVQDMDEWRALVNACENGNELSCSVKYWEILE
jgi:hypothetical protein